MGDESPATIERTKRFSEFLERKKREREESKNKAASASPGSGKSGRTSETDASTRDETHKVVVEAAPTTDKKQTRKERQSTPPTPESQQAAVFIPSAQARDMLIFMFNSMAAMSIGEYARLSEQEYAAIAQPLERMLQRMPAEAASKFGEYADPIMLIMGFGMWGFRVFWQVPNYMRKQQAQESIETFERSISRDVPLDPSVKARKPADQPQAGMKEPAPDVNTNGTGKETETPTGIRPDMQQLWEQKLD